MPHILRVTATPPLNQITALPQIVIVDQTGPAVSVGTSPGAVCLVGEFTKGPFVPTEVTSGGQIAALYGGVYPYFSQDGSTPPVQNGSQTQWNGNGMLQLTQKTFQRLVLMRVNMDAVTADAGNVPSQVTLTITVNANDISGGVTNKDIFIPAGTRFGDNVLFASATKVVGTSGDTTIPKGTTSAGTVTVAINCYVIKEPEPISAITATQINAVIDAALPNVDPGTTITGVNNANAIWPPGTGTTLALRIESQYVLAIGGTLPSQDPQSQIVVVWAARRSTAIRAALSANATAASITGRGRMCVVSADPATGTTPTLALAGLTAALGLTGTEPVLASDRVIVTWPHTKILSTELGGVLVQINPDGWMATTLSNFANEVNPGAENAFIQAIQQLEDAYVLNPLQRQDYVNLEAAGISAIEHDRAVGWWFSNGVTGVNPAVVPTRKPISRRRMADEIQDSLAQIAGPYLKQPATQDRVDAFSAEMTTYLAGLQSENNLAAQRIQGFFIDSKSGNTDQLEALGVFVWIISVKLLDSLDYIVLNTQIGSTVTIPVQQAA